MEKIAFLVILLSAAVYSDPFESCGEKDGESSLPKFLYIYKCPSFPCTFVYGGHVTGVYTAFTNFTNDALDPKEFSLEMQVEHGGETHQVAVEAVNKCTGLPAAECAFDGDITNFFFMFNVYLETQEEEVLPFELSMKSKNGTTFSCAKFTAKVVRHPPTTGSPTTAKPEEN